MNASTIFLIALLLACPLMMLLMHRGHRGKDSEHPEHGAHGAEEEVSLDELRSRKTEIEAEIARREELESGKARARR